MSAPTGGPAYPFTRRDSRSEQIDDQYEGMTLRDYFAAKALQGLLAHIVGVDGAGPKGYACRAYEYADAMLSERSKP